MFRRVLALFIIAIAAQQGSFAQLSVSAQTDVQQLAASITGPGVAISNPTINCHSLGYGQFTYSGSAIDVQQGVILTNGKRTIALGPNEYIQEGYNQSRTGDPLLNAVTGKTTYDACIFEFDLIPAGDSIQFEYVFGSEEYPEWVGSNFNDVFGFFISGPGITGDPGAGGFRNIALIPGTSTAITINNVNASSNNAYFHDNTGGTETEYDGYTVGLVARSPVQSCQTYHLKLMVADAADHNLDSGVLINKLKSNTATMTSSTTNGTPYMVEGCNPGVVRFARSAATPLPTNVWYYLDGSATNGTDYGAIGNVNNAVIKTITIPAGQVYADLPVNPFTDALNEGTEQLRFILVNPGCPAVPVDTLFLPLQDSIHTSIAPASAALCTGGSAQFTITGGMSYAWGPGSGLSCTTCANPIAAPTSTTTYTATVSEGACSETFTRTITVSQLSLSATTTASCGTNTGAIDLTAMNGVPPYTYSWTGPGGFTSAQEDISALLPGNYSVTVSDGSCTRNAVYTVLGAGSVSVTVAVTDISCFGGNDGALDATVTGSSGPFTYSWTGPGGFTSTQLDLLGVPAGVYTLTVTNAYGCTFVENRTIGGPSTPLSASITALSAVNCPGEATGSATVTAAGGTAPYTYAWNTVPAQSNATANNLPAGTWTATITDANGCVATTNAVINEPMAPLSASVIGQVDVACSGDASGSATVNATGGSAPYSYSWNTVPAQTSATAIGLAAGAYSCVVTDANGCTTNVSVTIIAPAQALSASISSSAHVMCQGTATGHATISVAGGTAPYSYNWNTVPVQNTATANALAAGSYACTVTDNNGCSTTVNVSITEPASALQAQLGPRTNVICSGDATGSATVSASGGTAPYTYTWNTVPVQNTATATALTAGNYSCTVEDNNGCINTVNTVITEPSAPLSASAGASTNENCYGDFAGSATVNVSGGTGVYNITWNTMPVQTGAMATGLSTGTYTASIADVNGCSFPASIHVTVNGPMQALAITATITDVACYGGSDGAIDLAISGGVAPYSFYWTMPDNGHPITEDLTGLSAGTHEVVVTDQHGCTITSTCTIAQPAPLSTVITVTDVACQGSNSGAIAVSTTGGTPAYTHAWSGPAAFNASTEDINTLVAGTYVSVIHDANNCEHRDTVLVAEPTALNVTAAITPAACMGANNGSVNVTITGGVPPYTYAWSGPGGFTSTAQDISGLAAGVYTLDVTDANGCTNSGAWNVAQPGLFTVSGTTSVFAGGWNVSCANAADGAIQQTIAGGTPPYNVTWSGPNGFSSTNEDLGGLAAGVYNATITDANGCSALATYTMLAPDPLTIGLVTSNHSGDGTSCAGTNDGAVDATVTGGTPGYTILWNGPDGYTSSNEDINALAAGTYVLTITDANGCKASANAAITAPAPLDVQSATASATNGDAIACAGENTGAIDLTISGGHAPYSVLWNGPGAFTANTPDIQNLIAGTYAATVTDANGCVSTVSSTLTEPTATTLTAAIAATNGYAVACAGAASAAIDLTINGGAGNASFSWTGPGGFMAGTEDISGIAAGVYDVIVTDQNGCTTNASFALQGPDPMSATAAITAAACQGGADGAIDLTISGGVAPMNFAWTGPNGFTSNTEDPSGLVAGDFTVQVIDANGCVLDRTFTVAQPNVFTIGAVISDHGNGHAISCAGAADGSIDVSVSGGTPMYSFVWSGPNGSTSTNEDLSGLVAGTYTLMLTDASGCSSSATYVLSGPAPILISTQTSAYAGGYAVACVGTASGSIDATISGGIGGYSTVWAGPGAFMANTEDLSALEAGAYTLLVTDGTGCTVSTTATLAAPPPYNVVLNASSFGNGNNISCGDAQDGAVDLNVSGGTAPYTVLWSGPFGFNSGSEDVTGLGAGEYLVVITDANGCTIKDSLTMVAPPALDLAITLSQFGGGFAIPCHGDTLGAAQLMITGGMGGHTINWTGPNGYASSATSLTGVTAGVYHLSVTDTTGCATDTTITLTEPDALQIDPTVSSTGNGYEVSCATNDGWIELNVTGGLLPYQFAWTDHNGLTAQSEDLSGLDAGSYSVTLTDGNGCVDTASFVLDRPAQLIGTTAVSGDICDGSDDGAIDLTLTGGTAPYTCMWTGPNGFVANTEDISDLPSGTYTVNVSDAGTCSGSWSASIVASPLLTFNALLAGYGLYNIPCAGDSTGAINLAVNGGAAPVEISWTGPNGFTSDTTLITHLTAGTYALHLSDANGCTADSTFTLTAPTAPLIVSLTPSLFPSGDHISCTGASDGGIDLMVSGGVSPYSFDWRGPDSSAYYTEDVSGLSAGTYEVVVADSNACTFFTTMTLSEPDSALSASLVTSQFNGVNVACAEGGSGSIAVAPSGGSPIYSYVWIGPFGPEGTTEAIDSLDAATYSVTITDVNGCSLDTTVELIAPEPLQITLDELTYTSGSNTSCASSTDGSISAAVIGGTAGYLYNWSGPNGYSSDVAMIDALAAGTYCLTVVDTNGCALQACTDLIAATPMNVANTNVDASCGGSNGAIDLSVSGGGVPYTFLWSNGPITEDISELAADTFVVTITDVNGCALNDTVVLNGTVAVEAAALVTDVACNGSSSGAIDLNVTAGTAPFAFAWSNDQETEDLVALTSDTYTITITDANGCTWENAFTVNEPDALVVEATVNMLPNGHHISMPGAHDGAIDLEVSGGTYPYTYAWSTGDQTSDVSGLPAGSIHVLVTDANGCMDSLSFELTEPKELVLPSGFSPNGDGTNDVYVIPGLEAYHDNRLLVMNRWGGVVFQREEYNNDWRGQNGGGEQLPDGTYFVILELNDGSITLQNYVDLRR